jgi:undecaprenyl pyrophosphate phosphatase UppP
MSFIETIISGIGGLMQLWQALLLGVLQGVSNLFPVSSLAHTILIPVVLQKIIQG